MATPLMPRRKFLVDLTKVCTTSSLLLTSSIYYNKFQKSIYPRWQKGPFWFLEGRLLGVLVYFRFERQVINNSLFLQHGDQLTTAKSTQNVIEVF